MAAPARDVVGRALAAGLTVATAESLTAGMVAAELATVPGASGMLQGGVVAYQNSVKEHLLGVDAGLLATAGSVDGTVARQMAAGARRALGADIGVATTGAAGPEPHDGKSVGTVFIGIAAGQGSYFIELHLAGDRGTIRRQACEAALDELFRALEISGRG